jgi:hypothetical protein
MLTIRITGITNNEEVYGATSDGRRGAHQEHGPAKQSPSRSTTALLCELDILHFSP